jgi:hypothetical protein
MELDGTVRRIATGPYNFGADFGIEHKDPVIRIERPITDVTRPLPRAGRDDGVAVPSLRRRKILAV